MSSEEMVDAVIVAHKFVGPNFVLARLEDGTEIKVEVHVQAHRLKDQKNPDGSPIYQANSWLTLSFRNPPGRTVKIPKSSIGPVLTQPKPGDKRIVS